MLKHKRKFFGLKLSSVQLYWKLKQFLQIHYLTTLRELVFAGINFHEFLSNSRKLVPAKKYWDIGYSRYWRSIPAKFGYNTIYTNFFLLIYTELHVSVNFNFSSLYFVNNGINWEKKCHQILGLAIFQKFLVKINSLKGNYYSKYQ